MVEKEKIQGKVKQAKGTIREAIGKAAGDDKQVVKGRTEQAEGRVQEVVGDVKGAVKEFGDKAKRTAEAVGSAIKDAKPGKH